MDVAIVTVGDELLIGQVVDSNSAWMGTELGKYGFRVVYKITVGDDEDDIKHAINEANTHAPLVLMTGGLGPTKDDVTLHALCSYFDSSLHFSEKVFDNIRQLFGRSGRTINELTRRQAMVPDRAQVILNRVGTAPCTLFRREGLTLISMPGVPSEMKWLMSNEALPRLQALFPQDTYIIHHSYRVYGFTESALALHLADFEAQLPPFIKLAYLPQGGSIILRLSAYNAYSETSISQHCSQLEALLPEHIIADSALPLEALAGERLRTAGATVATAESCTGGAIAAALTSIVGCSDYFLGSIVAYSNAVKINVLNVSEETLEAHGAVSGETVEQMAKAARSLLKSDYAIATSGIAGPGGGTPEKPVGTVWIAVASPNDVVSKEFHLTDVREENIRRSVNAALLMLIETLNATGNAGAKP